MSETADVETVEPGSCFSMQVETLLTAKESEEFDVITVLVEKEPVQNTVLDLGTDAQIAIDRIVNAFRAIPVSEK